MTTDLDRRAGESDDPALPARPWRLQTWFWPILVAMAFVVYELTAQPGLGAAVACTKFGWDDFMTAQWLRSQDTNRARGRAHFWLGLAVGLWKTAVTGILVMFVAAFLEAALRGPRPAGPPGRPSASFLAAFCVTFLGFGLSSVATLRAFRLAWRDRIRLWHDERLHRDRREGRWPPAAPLGRRRNTAGLVLLTALLVTGIVTPAIGFLLAFCALQIGRARLGWVVAWGEPAAAAIWLVLSLALPILLLIGRDVIGARALAHSPDECWNESGSDQADEVVAEYWQSRSDLR